MERLLYKNINFNWVILFTLSLGFTIIIILLLMITIIYIIIDELYLDTIIPEEIIIKALEISNNDNSKLETEYIIASKSFC